MTRPVVTTAFEISLLGDFRIDVRDGTHLHVSDQTARLFVFLALHGRRAPRLRAAAALWPEVNDASAQGNLRTVLHRLRQRSVPVAGWDDREIWLDPTVSIDFEEASALVERVRTGGLASPAELQRLSRELLQGWYDDWIVFEREGFRQLCMYTLERASGLLLDAGDISGALEVGWLAVACDELRESAHRCLIRVHLAEGNLRDALRERDHYVALLRAERLPVTLSPAMRSLFT